MEPVQALRSHRATLGSAMKITTRRKLWRAMQRLRNLSEPVGVILLYHRVAQAPTDPHSLCVTPEHFAQHLEILRRHGQPMRLQQLADALRNGEQPRRAVTVTFDDGYADNLYNAKPLLERYNIPATVFLTAGYIGSGREFWWDELDRLLLHPVTLPEALHLKVNGDTYHWKLGEAAHYTENRYQRHYGWSCSVSEKNDPGPRQQCYRSLCRMLRTLPEGERQKVLDELLEWAGAEPKGRPTHRPLSPDEVLHLAEEGLIDVGAHTKTHPVLSTISAAAQQDEIQQSKTLLEEILGRPVTSFAYPHGSRSDYTRETVTIVREAGFTCACSVLFDAVWRSTDDYQLPRVKVGDWGGHTFAQVIQWLLSK